MLDYPNLLSCFFFSGLIIQFPFFSIHLVFTFSIFLSILILGHPGYNTLAPYPPPLHHPYQMKIKDFCRGGARAILPTSRTGLALARKSLATKLGVGRAEPPTAWIRTCIPPLHSPPPMLPKVLITSELFQLV